MFIDEFTLKNGKVVKIDFTSCESIMSIPKSEMKEVKEQLGKCLEIICSQMSGEDVFALLNSHK